MAHEYRNNSHNYSDTGLDRRNTSMASQSSMGLWTQRCDWGDRCGSYRAISNGKNLAPELPRAERGVKENLEVFRGIVVGPGWLATSHGETFFHANW